MPAPARRVAPLLFGSGMCALVYQVAWLREFRLVFGASTAASAAVLAIFIGGLGVGGLLIGPRADRRRSPLAFYARLEAAIAISAALTPGLLFVVRWIYLELGGSVVLGLAGGTALRLALAALVLAVPTLLMGGTLPAAARAVESDEDAGRHGTALLYGVNTLGAVAGSFLATFVLLEALGTRRALWLACLVNLLVSVAARALARALPPEAGQARRRPAAEGARAPACFVLLAAAIVGFAFFLMELVWYRMLGPILGGSVFTFGLILSVALAGIGLGGCYYSLFEERRPASLHGFAWTCLLEAACLAVPLALGDRVAILAALLRPLGGQGFSGHVLGWTAVTSLVVLPAAFVSGVQFPMLIALLGRGREQVGRQIGQTYAWNTLGAIGGSLAGGFGLLPLLGAPGCWRAACALLLALGLATVALSVRIEGRRLAAGGPLAIAAGVIALVCAPGPSAAWRHSGIGVGRFASGLLGSRNGTREFLHAERRSLLWETDGVESSVALVSRMGMAFVINGKIDGHATLDAPTQVMSGLIGSLLHPRPRTALVVGLGTGSTAGWLGTVPGLERVDVVELERGVLEVARRCSEVNRRVLDNPAVHVAVGDAREVLLTTPRRYDLVFSEPSNPYRAGIASLFTREFYEAVAARLGEGGIFVQWVQAYEVSPEAVRLVYATLGSVFPEVETWRTHRDLLLLASRAPFEHRVDVLGRRVAEEPYRSALPAAWRVAELEGVLGYFVAAPSFARAVAAAQPGAPNTDDRNLLEFGFARAVGRHGLFSIAEALAVARARGEDRPQLAGGAVDWSLVEDERLRLYPGDRDWLAGTLEQRARGRAFQLYESGNLEGALAAWRSQPRAPLSPTELALVAEGLAAAGEEEALPVLERMRARGPAEADAVLARLRLRQRRHAEAASALEAAFARHQQDPWPRYELMLRALATARELALERPDLAPRVLGALRGPSAARALESERAMAAFDVAASAGMAGACSEIASAFEPWVPWRRDFLEKRLACYAAASDPRLEQAKADLAAFLLEEPIPFGVGLPPPQRPN